jgi:hypothetical protein
MPYSSWTRTGMPEGNQNENKQCKFGTVLLASLYTKSHTFSVVINRDGILCLIDINLDSVHGVVTEAMISSVDKNLIEDLVQTRRVSDGLHNHSALWL